MKKVIHRSEDRGKAEFGWLHSRHSFSFGHYYDPEKVNFGMLRVLNDDTVEPGAGFGTHPHDNMEIISIVLEGELAHKDSMGSKSVIYEGDVQVMSAGTGITHSEFNNSKDRKVKFLQIWIIPDEHGIKPRYEQKKYPVNEIENEIMTVVTNHGNDGTLLIHQKAAISLGRLNAESSGEYKVQYTGNGIYIFNLEGELNISGEILKERDAIGINETKSIEIKADKDSKFIVIEVPTN
jgi:quercetin 2,3-dioxygenase